MTDKEQLARLQQQINAMLLRQNLLQGEIRQVQRELDRLQKSSEEVEATEATTVQHKQETLPPPPVAAPQAPISEEKPPVPFDWEQYIGGNLISKIGIGILLLGLGLFVKYAIDKGLFPPVVRVVSGYAAGLLLVGTAYYLRKKYEAYSAVLFSGGMATLYFTTYIGCTIFEPPVLGLYVAFYLMSFFTVVTIVVAGYHDQQIIGLLGLVGAYAVPFLVNTGTQNYALFFSYITFINVGVLLLALRRGWHLMTHTACLLTWLIVVVALLQQSKLQHSPVAWAFVLVSLGLFYAAVLVGHRRRGTLPGTGAYLVLIIQALISFSVILVLTGDTFKEGAMGLATLLCAVLHFGAAFASQRMFENDRPFLVFSTIGVFFVTLAVPIEFHDNLRIIPVLWMAEVLALFFIGRKVLQATLYEVLAYLLLAFLGIFMMNYWLERYYSFDLKIFPALWNLDFLVSLCLVVGTFGLYFINRNFPRPERLPELQRMLKFLPPALLFLTFFHEIHHGFTQLSTQSPGAFGVGRSVLLFRDLWLFIYTAGALVLVAWGNARRWKSAKLELFVAIAGLACILLFITSQLVPMNELRRLFLTDSTQATVWFILIRYGSYGMLGWLYFYVHKTLLHHEMVQSYRPQVPLLLHFLILLVLSNELATVILLLLGNPDSTIPHKEGFSILWGLYSFLLIGLGFRKKSQTLRVAGMALFAITLVKIFFFDLVNLPILSRTVLFLALGALLLGASYLYQRFSSEQ